MPPLGRLLRRGAGRQDRCPAGDLTGSIASRRQAGGHHLLNKIGVITDPAERGANSGMFSISRFSLAERQRLDAFST
jgi:hypothetical protein